MARRLEMLPPGAVELAEAVAVLGDGWPLDAAAMLAGLDGEAAAGSADALAPADIFARDLSLRFSHPLVRAAMADRLSAARRAAAHARAARILAALATQDPRRYRFGRRLLRHSGLVENPRRAKRLAG